jgi:hypothetical protein
MTPDEFLKSPAPADDWTPALKALWHAEQGEWETAHGLCQQGDTAEGAWVHANLHREEGDPGNARYWYARAGKPESGLPIGEERREILAALLA